MNIFFRIHKNIFVTLAHILDLLYNLASIRNHLSEDNAAYVIGYTFKPSVLGSTYIRMTFLQNISLAMKCASDAI